MSDIKIGDYAKVIDENIVFKVAGFTKGLDYIPDGFLLDGKGSHINPAFCKKYEGAVSVIEKLS